MSAKKFFLTELPPLLAELKRVLGDRVPKLSYELEFEIEGEGMYSVIVEAGDVTVRRGGAPEPVVAMRFAKTTWDDALSKLIRPRLQQLRKWHPANLEADATAEMKRQLGERTLETPETILAALKSLPMRVLLKVPGTAHNFELALAGAEENDPTITLTVQEADIDALLAGTLGAQDAFKQGKIKAKGAMSAAVALSSRVIVG